MSLRHLTMVTLVMICLMVPFSAFASEKWLGTDDLVDQKMEEVTGVSAREPLIDISQGNVGLFIFASGGFAAGLVIGYQWRKIFHEKAGR